MSWLPMESAPKDGTVVQLRGKYSRYRFETKVEEVEGHYDVGGFTEGWEDERSNWFMPTEWKPLK